MLVIRFEQMAALEQITRGAFERRVVAHVRRDHPVVCAQMGEPLVEAAVQLGVDRARERGLLSEWDVARFVDAVFTLGPDFDTDPAFEWIAAPLADATLSPRLRMDIVSARISQLVARDRSAQP